MNRLDLLLRKWKAGSVKDPDLFLCLSYIHKMKMSTNDERKDIHIEGTDSVSREDDSIKPKRSKAKRL